MSEWAEVLRAPVDHDLGPFCRYLRAEHIPVYVFEREGEQCLCVPTAINAERLQTVVGRWQRGEVDVARYAHDSLVAAPGSATVFALWRQFPLTLLLCVASLLVFVMVATPWGQVSGGMQWLAWMTLQPLSIHGDDIELLAQLPPLAEVWRYWTPMFLHFSLFHILFNGLMLLELGRRIESVQGSLRLLFLVMACGLASNLAQFYTDADTLFGGMSGVIYALVGYSWLYQRLRPQAGMEAPSGLMVMALVWLLICFSGLVTVAGMGRIANAAHVGGLVSGLVIAVLLAWLDKSSSPHEQLRA